jgi:hypothetical protein
VAESWRLLQEEVILFARSMTMANLVGEKGQIVIEKPLREALGVQPGFFTVQTLVDDHVEIRFDGRFPLAGITPLGAAAPE